MKNRNISIKTLFIITLFLIMGCMLLSSAQSYIENVITPPSSSDVSNFDADWVTEHFEVDSWPVPEIELIAPLIPKPLGFDETAPKRAYLTFDDGPSQNTRKILDILDRYGVKATFFVIGKPNMTDEYRLIVERGHTIALHSYSHKFSEIYSSEQAYFNDIRKLRNLIYEATGYSPNILRFAGGSSNTISNKHCKGIMKRLVVAVEEQGYVYFDWNVDSGDADDNNVPAEKLIENIKNRIGRMNVINILMHDTGRTKNTTVEALPEIIEFLQQNGYEICPITENTKPVHHRLG